MTVGVRAGKVAGRAPGAPTASLLVWPPEQKFTQFSRAGLWGLNIPTIPSPSIHTSRPLLTLFLYLDLLFSLRPLQVPEEVGAPLFLGLGAIVEG